MRRFHLAVGLALLSLGVLPTAGFAATGGYGSAKEAVLSPTIASDNPALSAQRSESTTLWGSTTLDAVANDVAGTTDMTVLVEDDPTEWASFFPPSVDSPDVLGFVSLTYAPLYHKIYLAPVIYPVFGAWFTSGSPVGDEYGFAVAAMDLIHESFHWRLMSGDESTVNACALKYLPYYLEADFKVPSTVTQTSTEEVPTTTTTTVPVKHVKITKKRVRVHGKWVIRKRQTTTTVFVTRTTTTYQATPVTTEVPNPLFQTITADAAEFYSTQPPPYNSGICSV